MVKKQWSFARWKKEAWSVFSKFIRVRDKGVCYTCGREGFTGSGYHAGHYATQGASNMFARFNEIFVRGQCYACNILKNGNTIEFRKHLVKDLGEAAVVEFENTYQRVPTGRKWGITDFQEVIEKYS